tara:strand:+ start:237 stop:491 length:255 start_codon:yes stop_codon:yes gene_type:complete
MIIESILKLKSDAKVTVIGNDIDTCTINWHDNNPTNITKEQIKIKISELETEIEQEKQDAINNKTSAHNKLKELGLTDAEIEAL